MNIDFNEDRFFNHNQNIRPIARELYNGIKNLPIISPHGHVDPKILADNNHFSNPTNLLLTPDHYIFRMLYSQGIKLEELGIPVIDGSVIEKDPRKIWQIFCEHYYLFLGTPTSVWLNYVFFEVFELNEVPNQNNALEIFDQIEATLKKEEFKPREIFDRFNIEVLCTTESADDSLKYHKKIKDSNWDGKVITAFRPDAVMNIAKGGWIKEIKKLSKIAKIEIDSYKRFIEALEDRRAFFKEMGATSTDQGIEIPYTGKISDNKAEEIFQRGLSNKADDNDQVIFIGNMLLEMARMSIDDGLVMQIHTGSFRNHNEYIYKKFGPDKGADIPLRTEYSKNLHSLLNNYGNTTKLSLIVFTLDESAYARELAPLAGHYPAMKLGAPWWFNDSIQGMKRFRQSVTETAGIYNTVGFTDDTRAFLSIPARHDLSRRIDSNFLANQVAQHIITMNEAKSISKDLAYNLAKKAYKL